MAGEESESWQQMWAHPDQSYVRKSAADPEWVLTFEQTEQVLDIMQRAGESWVDAPAHDDHWLAPTCQQVWDILRKRAYSKQLRDYAKTIAMGTWSSATSIAICRQLLEDDRPGGWHDIQKIAELWNSRADAQKALTAGGHLDVDDIVPSEQSIAALLEAATE